jgi:hypothetical protein
MAPKQNPLFSKLNTNSFATPLPTQSGSLPATGERTCSGVNKTLKDLEESFSRQEGQHQESELMSQMITFILWLLFPQPLEIQRIKAFNLITGNVNVAVKLSPKQRVSSPFRR